MENERNPEQESDLLHTQDTANVSDETMTFSENPENLDIFSDIPEMPEDDSGINDEDLSLDQLLADSASLCEETEPEMIDSAWLEDPALAEAEDSNEIPADAPAEDSISQDEDFTQILEDVSSLCADTPEVPEYQEASSQDSEQFTDSTDAESDNYYEDDPTAADSLSHQDPAVPAKGSKIPSVKKRRPAMKKGYGLLGIPHILATFVWLALILAIGITLGRTIWVCAADMLAFGKESSKVVVTIAETDTPDAIAQKLKDAGLIRYPELFKTFMKIKGAEEEISAGTFTLDTIYDYNALVNSMTPYADGRQEVDITIPEGYTCAQIFNLLAENDVCTVEELEEYAANGELPEYWFLEGVTRGDKYCLEGFLFPDTYRFYTKDDPDRVLEKLLDAFDDRFTDTMKEWFENLKVRMTEAMQNAGRDEEYIASHQLTIRDVVIVASMIEKESSGPSESRIISSVIYNRLTDWDMPYLNIDATIIYALGGKDGPLTESDLQVDSPYNTYTHMGLTPGPIANPGRESIYAALDPFGPQDENYNAYYYYALDPETGSHKFFETSGGFEEFIDSVSYGE